jgi:LuxR family transcriptional regulator
MRADLMKHKIGPAEIQSLAPAGHYIALRIGFAFPVEEINALPPEWVDHYTKNRFMLFDPIIRWAYSSVGALRWSEIPIDDPRKIISQAQTFGLRYGAAVSIFDGNEEGQRSFGSFVRGDREYSDLEINLLHAYVKRRHTEMAPPTNLTMAELEALGMVRNGKRLKEIAFDLGVSEGAVKQRLKNAKLKLNAKTGTQAAALASQYGLI